MTYIWKREDLSLLVSEDNGKTWFYPRKYFFENDWRCPDELKQEYRRINKDKQLAYIQNGGY